MANAKTNTKVTKENIKKEETVMTDAQVKETKVKAPKSEKVNKEQVTKNEEKKNTYLTIQEVAEMYKALGIKCTNESCKGNYRIMGSKSSLNLKPTKGYYIYTSDSDFELIQASKVSGDDLVIEKGTNAQDKQRPNTIICTVKETLEKVLKVYATNPLNKVAAVEAK